MKYFIMRNDIEPVDQARAADSGKLDPYHKPSLW